MPAPDPRIAVIGGGVSGLVAARHLAHAGAEVTLYEAGERLGGRLCAAELAGTRIDIGAEAFATRGGHVARLLDELGLAGEIVSPARRGSWVVDATPDRAHRAVPLPVAGSLGIPAFPLSRQAIRALGVAGAFRAACEPLLPGIVGRRSRTIGALVRARLGPRAHDRVVAPVARGVYSSDPDRLSLEAVPGLTAAYSRYGSLTRAAAALREANLASGGAVQGLRGGMTALVDALAENLRTLGARIVTHTRIDAADLAALPVDGVLVATAEPASRALLRSAGAHPAPGHGSDPDADRAEEASVEVVAFAIDDARLDAAPRGTGALVAHAGDAAPLAPDTIRAKALTHVTAKWPHLARAVGARPGRHILRLSYGRAGQPPATRDLADADALRLAVADASRILGIALDPADVCDVVRRPWHAGRPLGTAERARLADALTVPATGTAASAPLPVRCAGDWVHGTGLASVIPGATRTADALLAAILHDPAETLKDPA